MEKPGRLGYPTVKNFWTYVYSFWLNSQTWQTETDTQTDTARQNW